MRLGKKKVKPETAKVLQNSRKQYFSRIWTQEEKSKALTALKKYGKNYAKLMLTVPNKTLRKFSSFFWRTLRAIKEKGSLATPEDLELMKHLDGPVVWKRQIMSPADIEKLKSALL
jgi:hypothetical protein